MYRSLVAADVWVILIYFGMLLTVGFYYSRRDTASVDFFLAGKNAGWPAVGSSLFAANISGEHFIGLAGSGAALGIAAGNFELIGCLMVLVLGWFFAPIYIKMGICTVPEFFERRFGRLSRMYLSAVSLAAYAFTKISVTILAGGFLLHETIGWDMGTSAVVIVAFAGIYSIAGGLNAIIRVDVLQAALLIAGAAVLTVAGLNKVGGFSALRQAVPDSHFHLIKSISDPAFPWTGVLLGAPVLGAWYWCTDQYIVQRVLAAKNIPQARGGTILAGFLKLLPVGILVLPGIIARALYGNGELTDSAFALLAAGSLLPAGLKGLVIAGLLAALISSLASGFNASASLFTLDYYANVRKNASDDQLMLTGRLVTAGLIMLTILTVPFIRFQHSDIYIYMLSIQSFICPPIVAVCIWGLLLKRGAGCAALTTLITGGAVGAVKLFVELAKRAGHSIWKPAHVLAEINFLHFAFFLFVFSSAVFFVVSFFEAGRVPGAAGIMPFSYRDQIRLPAGSGGARRTLVIHTVLSGLLIVAVVTLYIIFF